MELGFLKLNDWVGYETTGNARIGPYPKIGVGFGGRIGKLTQSLMTGPFHWLPIWFLICARAALGASPVVFDAVEATYFQGTREDLARTIDGIDASGRGWSVAPRIDQAQSIVFTTAAPINANVILLTLCFQSGRPNGSIAECALSFTSDSQPSLNGNWRPLPIVNQSATTGSLTLTTDQRLRAGEVVAVTTGRIPDNNYQITARTTGHVVTGFRIDVFPVRRTLEQLLPEVTDVPVMAWAMGGDFVLTEFRAAIITHSTNVALGAPVKASHPLYQTMTPVQVMTPMALTDGLPSTFAHPRQPDIGSRFFFEIDLGSVHDIDHISLWGRNDVLGFEKRLSRLHVRLHEEDPSQGAEPVWQGIDRADGSHPQRGEVDILRAADGKGRFRGRYLRLSTDSEEPLSPQLAEVEVYAARPMVMAGLRADGREIEVAKTTVIPPGTRRLSMEMGFENIDLPPESGFRWRLPGVQDDWRVSRGRLLEMTCPPAGNHLFEAQAAHSDGMWDAMLLSQKLTVRKPFTDTAGFYWLLACATLSTGVLITWVVSRRRIVALEAQTALAAERTRIARDMHDEVGARLSQLSFLLKAFQNNTKLPENAKQDVRQLSETATQALGSLDEVVWTVNPKNDTLESLARFIGQYAVRYLEPLSIGCRIGSPPAWPHLEVSAQTRHHIVMSVKEALQNVIKHSNATQVNIGLALADGSFVVRIADNGCGLGENTRETGRSGLANMESRLKSIGGSFSLRRSQEGGTEVELTVPIGKGS
jgi:signal transduction histidine kinase